MTVESCGSDLGSETTLRIQVKELLFDYSDLPKVIDEKKSWFTRMEVLDSIYLQFLLNANSLGRLPTTLQLFQPVALQTLALVAAAIHCALSEYATGRKITVMFSQDEYRGKFCPSTVLDCITGEATVLINYPWWAASYPPPWVSSAIIGTTQSPSVLLSLDLLFHFLFSAPYCISVGAPSLDWAHFDLDHDRL